MPGLNIRLYECVVTGVYAHDRIFDARSRRGTRFSGLSYLTPWLSADGSGIDFVPKSGDVCLVLAEAPHDDNRRGLPRPGQSERGRLAICIGFKNLPTVGGGGFELGQRIEMPDGSICLRCRSETGGDAKLLLTRGGTAILGINDICQSVYSPIDDSITHIFNTLRLKGPGGFVSWSRAQGSEDVVYEAEYRTKTLADKGHAVRVKIGDPQAPVSVTVTTAGYPHPNLKISVTADGEALVEAESLKIVGRAGVEIDGAQVKIKGRQVLGQGDPI